MSQQTKTINHILQNDDSLLGQLIHRAKALDALDKMLQTILGATLQDRFKVGGYEKGILTLLTDNSATATQMRYQVPEILSTLRKSPEWAGLISIKIKVHQHWHAFQTPAPEQPTSPTPQQPFLSEASKQTLQSLMESLSEDPNNAVIVKSLHKLIQSG